MGTQVLVPSHLYGLLTPRVDGAWWNVRLEREDSGKGEPCSGVWEKERVMSLLGPRETPLQRKVCLFLAVAGSLDSCLAAVLKSFSC